MRKTDEEISRAKSIDILQIAEAEGYEFKRFGRSYHCKNNEGLVIFPDTNSYNHFYENQGGSVVDFVMKERNLSFHEAIDYLLSFIGYVHSYERAERPKAVHEKKPDVEIREKKMQLPPANDNYKRAFAYLCKSRCIAPDIISKLMHEKRIYEEREHHNVVFVATDMHGTPRHGFIRGTISEKKYRGDVFDSDKEYGFSVEGKTDTLIVCEAPIDVLSLMTLYPNDNNHKLATGMLALPPVYKYLEEHQNINRIVFMIDNDARADKAYEGYTDNKKVYHPGFFDKLSDKYEVLKHPLLNIFKENNIKDVNEYLVYRKTGRREVHADAEPEQRTAEQRYTGRRL